MNREDTVPIEIDFARLSELDYFSGYEPVATALKMIADPEETEDLKSTYVGEYPTRFSTKRLFEIR